MKKIAIVTDVYHRFLAAKYDLEKTSLNKDCKFYFVNNIEQCRGLIFNKVIHYFSEINMFDVIHCLETRNRNNVINFIIYFNDIPENYKIEIKCANL